MSRRPCLPPPPGPRGVSGGEVEPESTFVPPHPKPQRRSCWWIDYDEARLAELQFRPLLLRGRAFPGVACPGGSDSSCSLVPFRPPAAKSQTLVLPNPATPGEPTFQMWPRAPHAPDCTSCLCPGTEPERNGACALGT